MPTTRARHQITETDHVARAIDTAAQAWPGLSRSQLAVKLILAGAEGLDGEAQREADRRRTAIRAHAGEFTGVFEPGYLEALREDWPA